MIDFFAGFAGKLRTDFTIRFSLYGYARQCVIALLQKQESHAQKT
jgi:hypothetical protein